MFATNMLKMEILGSIVAKRKIKDCIGFVEVVNSIDAVSDKTKPILIIGYNEVKKLFDNVSILNKKISDNIFWTFGKTEKRADYENDLKSFYNHIILNAINNVKYYYVNIFKLSYTRAKNLLSIINNGDKKYIYISNNIIYIYYGNYILGISLEVTEYIGIKKKKIVDLIRKNENNIVGYSDSFLDLNVKKIIDNKKYAMPYLMALYNIGNEK